MKPHNTTRLYLAIIFLSLAILACTVPVALTKFGLPGDLQKTEVAYIKPTLVNEENQVIGLSDYYCHDVDGFLSSVKKDSELIKTRNFLEGNVIISWYNYNKPELGQINVEYFDEFQLEFATTDGASGNIVSWTTSGWSGTGSTTTEIEQDGTFSGSIEVTEERWESGSDVVTKVTEIHNFFGYISKEDGSAYFCDLLPNPIPSDLTALTADNFQNYCQFHYYECQPSSP